MERSIIELATKTHLLLVSVDRFLLEQPSLVNKSKRQLFPVVLQRQQLADALARYVAQLELKRQSRPMGTLQELLAKPGSGTIIPFVFHRDGKPIKSFRKTRENACTLAGVPDQLVHDFRRTAVRNLVRTGVPRSVAMKLTGHKQKTSTGAMRL